MPVRNDTAVEVCCGDECVIYGGSLGAGTDPDPGRRDNKPAELPDKLFLIQRVRRLYVPSEGEAQPEPLTDEVYLTVRVPGLAEALRLAETWDDAPIPGWDFKSGKSSPVRRTVIFAPHRVSRLVLGELAVFRTLSRTLGCDIAIQLP